MPTRIHYDPLGAERTKLDQLVILGDCVEDPVTVLRVLYALTPIGRYEGLIAPFDLNEQNEPSLYLARSFVPTSRTLSNLYCTEIRPLHLPRPDRASEDARRAQRTAMEYNRDNIYALLPTGTKALLDVGQISFGRPIPSIDDLSAHIRAPNYLHGPRVNWHQDAQPHQQPTGHQRA
jgi:hypothetical protein